MNISDRSVPASKNWHPIAKQLARLLDEAMTIPKVALEHRAWSHEAATLIASVGLKPGQSTASRLYKRYQEPQR